MSNERVLASPTGRGTGVHGHEHGLDDHFELAQRILRRGAEIYGNPGEGQVWADGFEQVAGTAGEKVVRHRREPQPGGPAENAAAPAQAIVQAVPRPSLSSIEFPADDPARARRFWAGLLGVELQAREEGEGEGWQTGSAGPTVGVHERGRGPGDSLSLPYFTVSDMAEALENVQALGGSIVHPGERWAVCKDSEGSPFGLAQEQ